jgi:hypothetical protein
MTRTELRKLTLNSKVKLTPQGKVYTVILSPLYRYKAALVDEKGKVRETSPATSVYVISKG